MPSSYTPSSGIGGSTGGTDNAILRADGTGGSTLQGSTATLDDSGNVGGIGTLTTSDRAFIGSDRFAVQFDRVVIGNSMSYSWSASPTNSASNTFIFRDADNVVALRNSTNGQTFILSRTFTDASNYSQVALTCTVSTLAFSTQEAGTGIGAMTGYVFDKPMLINGGATLVKILTGSGTLGAGTVNASSYVAVPLTVTGAAAGDTVEYSIAPLSMGLVLAGVEVSADTVTFNIYNTDVAFSHDVASQAANVRIIKTA